MTVAALAASRVTVVGARVRLPLMAVGLLALLGALEGGLVRLGWPLPSVPALATLHGPLMVGGFLGTVIALERAVAIGRAWAYVAPLATALGAVASVAGAAIGPWLITAGSVVTVLVFGEVVRRQRAVFTVTMGLGAIAWLIGQVLWLAGRPLHRVVFWWIAFLVLTIAGERLELTRLRPLGPAARGAFVLVTAALLAGLVAASIVPDRGVRVAGLALLALGVWLAVFDIARTTVKTRGVTRFIAAALLSGYAWLGAAGVLTLWFGDVAAGPRYDAIMHAVFLGCVFSMIFGHAPIIFPALLGVAVVYRPRFYGHLGLLHASLVFRIVGDVGPWPSLRQWGGLLNGLAIVVFLVSTVHAVLTAQPRG